jgi:hypothetical protein
MTAHKSEDPKARKVLTSNLSDSVSQRMNRKGRPMAHIRFLGRRSCAANSPRTSNWWLATALAAGTALGTISWPSPGAAQTPPPPKGLIALYQYPGCAPSPEFKDFKERPCPSGALSENAAENPAIAGLMIRVDWLDMYRPQWSSLIDWSITDAVFAQALKYGKFVVLSFVPGFATPQWALSQIMLKDEFCIQYGSVPFVAKAGQSSTLPMPWDTTYQNLWSNFLQQVSLRYASNPQFRMIAAAGPTSISEEMSLPGAGAPGECKKAQIDTENLTTWPNHSYTADMYIKSWDQVFGKYASFFSGQVVSLALYQGLPVGASKTVPFPKTDTPPMVIGKGTANLPLTFAVEANGLTPDSPGKPIYDLVVKSHVSKLVTGFEFATSALLKPEQQGDAADPTNALCLSLQTGLSAGVDYLEIYEEDANTLDPSVQALLQTAANQLLSPPGTSRTPLPCHIPRILPCGPTPNTCQ